LLTVYENSKSGFDLIDRTHWDLYDWNTTL